MVPKSIREIFLPERENHPPPPDVVARLHPPASSAMLATLVDARQWQRRAAPQRPEREAA